VPSLTHAGGPPAEREQISVTYLDQYRIVGGHISELWRVREGLALVQQTWHSFHVFAEPGISPECRTSTQCLQHRLGGSRASSKWF